MECTVLMPMEHYVESCKKQKLEIFLVARLRYISVTYYHKLLVFTDSHQVEERKRIIKVMYWLGPTNEVEQSYTPS